MAALTPVDIVQSGVDPGLVNAASGGDTFSNTGREFLYVNNGHSAAINVTIVTPQTVEGLAVADQVTSLSANKDKFYGPLPTATFASGGITSFNVSAGYGAVKVSAVRFSRSS
jgi:hypothetical protein